MFIHPNISQARFLLGAALAVLAALAQAAVGLTQVPGKDGDGAVTVYYPSDSQAQPLRRGPFTIEVAYQGIPQRGNGRLIIISHGSGGSPWEHADLARILVEDGFVVALPEHLGDNYKDFSMVGPESWKRRPTEVSHAIDAVMEDARFAPLLASDRVGMYGMSAGGHTALTLAGGRWSPARLEQHCEEFIAEDFQTCVGLSARLNGGLFDGLKKTIALSVIRSRLADTAWYTHADPRIAAAVAGVPFAADFDMASLAAPRIPLALVTARQDQWLPPRFHSDLVLQACKSCEWLADFPNGGHGALLSPMPPGLTGLIGDLLKDPPGFDRAGLPAVYRKISAFFHRHLLTRSPSQQSVR